MVKIKIQGDKTFLEYVEKSVGKEYLENIVRDSLSTKLRDDYGLDSVRRIYKRGEYKVVVDVMDNNVVGVDIVDTHISIKVLSLNAINDGGELVYNVESYNDLVYG